MALTMHPRRPQRSGGSAWAEFLHAV